MKNITKDNKGITLIALVITVLIMITIASVTVYTGIDTYKTSQIERFVIEMQLLQAKVDDLVATNTIDDLNNMGLQSVTTEQQIKAITNAFKQDEIINANTSKYKVFTKDDILNILDVEDVQDDIMVNFETREIVSTVGIEYKDVVYYTQYKLPGGQILVTNSTTTDREVSFNANMVIDGLNATITINNIRITNGALSYKETGSDYWTTITNYTEKGKEYIANISKSGNYIFKLQDNVNSENFTEKTITVTVTNKPKTEVQVNSYNYGLASESWAYTQNGSAYYVWIPRFAYDANNNIKYIKGNSNIATDNTYIDNTWTIHDKFMTEDNVKLTGIWVSVNSKNQTGLNLITLLNDNTRTVLTEI